MERTSQSILSIARVGRVRKSKKGQRQLLDPRLFEDILAVIFEVGWCGCGGRANRCIMSVELLWADVRVFRTKE